MSNKHKFSADRSDAIDHCDYEDATNTLKIKFRKSSKEHDHPGCPKSIHAGLIAAESPGKYYHTNIRKQYPVKP